MVCGVPYRYKRRNCHRQRNEGGVGSRISEDKKLDSKLFKLDVKVALL